jgi:hypothetical protein
MSKPEPSEKRPLSTTPEPEFEDENPGSYLSELGTRRASVIFGAANFAAVLLVGITVHMTRLDPQSTWFPLARLLWRVFPVSLLLLGIVTLWQLGTAYTQKSPSRVLLSLLFSLAGFGLWAFFEYGLGVLPEDP